MPGVRRAGVGGGGVDDDMTQGEVAHLQAGAVLETLEKSKAG